jgi:glycosyltransferase involved in cell wall biosynthesis
MSITVLEAMTLNIPVVVVASIGPSEFIVNDENGILVQPKIDDLYKGIVKMLANKDLRDKFSKSNRLLLLNYSQENILNKFYKLISGDNNI